MYYLAYGFFYLLSLLPFWVIYLISDGVYGLLHYIIGYRKKMVMRHLQQVFPEKNDAWRLRTAKDFYRGFTDTFLEAVKMLSISEKEIRKRMTVEGAAGLNSVLAEGRGIQVLGGHFMNWEYANHGLALHCLPPTLGVYMPLSNKVFDKIMQRLRSRFGTILIPAGGFKASFEAYVGKPYALMLGADQKPGNPTKAYWADFFGKPAPFVPGPEVGARKNNAAVAFANYYRVRRGYYHCKLSLITTNPHEWAEGAITIKFKELLEAAILQNPSSYLWTHNRWKHAWKPEYASLWVDTKPHP